MNILVWVAVIIILITSAGLLIARDWRISVVFLAAQYLAMFILLLPHLPLGMASVKVVTGWMCSAILGMTRSDLTEDDSEESLWPRGRLFSLFAAGMVVLIVAGATPSVSNIMADAGTAVTAGGLLLVGLGLLHLGITSQILRVTQGLLTVITGFEIIYSSVESSALVVALLVIINLGLALVGSYLMIASQSREPETM
ncbi:MAG TPA: hypothetical protein PKK96_02975 [Anaerolineales bacterium]|nr:hypothetical protein [Anaerolineales bacterium]HMS00061.1 hypothetical protein [Anaerolineales bacterium]HNQ93734.1 hypothetical protein [Anaerolineales bacterium]HNS59943.1 hypothetical protein [Anaerolineales bacterium]